MTCFCVCACIVVLHVEKVCTRSWMPAMIARRCSGDFCHAKHADDAIRGALARPLFWGWLANVDEVYESFQEFGLYQAAAALDLVHQDGRNGLEPNGFNLEPVPPARALRSNGQRLFAQAAGVCGYCPGCPRFVQRAEPVCTMCWRRSLPCMSRCFHSLLKA